ncbi:MAG: hypothetical protein QOG39_784 [Acidimicrobiaceae bacterium]
MSGRGARRVGAVMGIAVVLNLAAIPSSQGRPAAGSGHLVYAAMGDSYTSGPLVLPHDTTWVPEDCGQSVRNYPHLAAAAIGATTFTDVSCGSATIDDLYQPQTGLPLGGVNAPQLDAAGPDADVVTLGMAGNDVGFVGLALGCIRLVGPPVEQPCSPAYTAGGRDRVSERIAAVGPELGKALRDIHAKAPHAQVFVVSYPTALPDNGVACWPYVPILPEDMPYLVAKYKEMNAMLAAQAAANDATYIDIYTSSIGHDACQIPAVAWVNGVVVVPPSYPAHPNDFGLANAGRVVAAAIEQQLAATAPAVPAEPSSPNRPAPQPASSAAPAPGGTLPVTGGGDRSSLAFVLLLIGAAATSLRRRAGANVAT